MSKYQQIATEIASLVERKQTSYGDAFGQAHLVLAILFPNGIPVERYTDVLTITRIVDKLFRIANNKELFAEDPWAAERPEGVECLPVGYDVEGDFFEVETDFCPWGVFAQDVQAPVAAGEVIRFVFWHSELWARDPAEGRGEIQVGGETVWAVRRAIHSR